MRIGKRETETLSERRQRSGEKGWGEGCPFVFGRGGRCQILGGLDTLLMPQKSIHHPAPLFFLYPSIPSFITSPCFLILPQASLTRSPEGTLNLVL
ncbi:hypothetical protein QQF64_011044 [Cirrhinus molitorella]